MTQTADGGGLPWGSSQRGDPISHKGLMIVERSAKWSHDFYLKNSGQTDAFVTTGDEQGAQWMIATRLLYRIEHKLGLQFYIAGHIENYFPSSVYILDGRPTAGFPSESDKVNL